MIVPTSRTLPIVLVSLVVALVAAATLFRRTPQRSEPERIVLIVVDTLRRDFLSCYRGSASTPNIDRLATRGRLFTNALGSFHQTTMSMGALFTGKTPSMEGGEKGVLDWNGRTWCGMGRFPSSAGDGGCLPSSLKVLGEVVRDRGYATIGVVANALLFAPAGFQRGFADWREIGEALPDSQHFDVANARAVHPGDATRVNAAVKDALKRRSSDRFFLYVHYMDVHEYKKGLGKGADWRRLYADAVGIVDAAIGELVGELETAGLLDGTVFVFTADHGERLKDPHFIEALSAFEPEPGIGHEGNPSFEELLHVPLIVSPANAQDDGTLVRSEDVFRLISNLAGATVDAPQVLEPDELFLTELLWHTYRRGRWKSFIERTSNTFHLVDLDADPLEVRDVAATYPAVVQQHRQRVEMLARTLTASAPPSATLTTEDKARLRALGYVE